MIDKGQKVKIHYTGTLDDGTKFDSSEGREPLEFEMGAGMVIPGFETGVADMSVGEKKSIHIPATEAYGERREEMVMEFAPRGTLFLTGTRGSDEVRFVVDKGRLSMAALEPSLSPDMAEILRKYGAMTSDELE